VNPTNRTTESTLNAGPTQEPGKKSFARYLTAAARILMGLVFFVFGLNGFLHFIPQPKTALPEFITALMNTGYMLP